MTMTDERLKDEVWRINNIYSIVNKQGKRINFAENPQQALINRDKSLEKAILKARQLGISTARLIYLFDKTIWNPNQNSVILAHKDDSLVKLFRIIYTAYHSMDPVVRPILDRGGGSRYEFFFPEINSRISCTLESRSETVQNLHISEFGLMKDDTAVKATVDTVPLGGEITYESTPKGLNHFHELWFDEDRQIKKFFFPWYSFPEYKLETAPLEYTDDEIELIGKALKYKISITPEQIAFRRWKILQKGSGNRGLKDFIEEFPEDEQSCFLSSGDAIFNLFDIRKMMDAAPNKPLKIINGIRIFKNVENSKVYVCGADCAEGVGGDLSVGVVMEAQSREVVAVFNGNVKPYEFAQKLNEMCLLYKTSARAYIKLAVERNNHGHAVLLELEEHLRYQNLYQRTLFNGDKDKNVGWVTDRISRPIMINSFIDAVENKYISINDKYIFNECLTLINNEGKIEAASTKHDDSIIATAIALQLAIEFCGIHGTYQNLKSKILL